MTAALPVDPVGKFSWPPVGRNGGHQWTGFMAANGQKFVALDMPVEMPADVLASTTISGGEAALPDQRTARASAPVRAWPFARLHGLTGVVIGSLALSETNPSIRPTLGRTRAGQLGTCF